MHTYIHTHTHTHIYIYIYIYSYTYLVAARVLLVKAINEKKIVPGINTLFLDHRYRRVLTQWLQK